MILDLHLVVTKHIHIVYLLGFLTMHTPSRSREHINFILRA